MLPTHTVTHMGKRTDGAHGAKSFRPHPFCGENARKALYTSGWRAFYHLVRMRSAVRIRPAAPKEKPVTVRVMFVGTQVDTVLCKGRTAFAVRFLAFFSLFFIMREAGEIPRLRAAQCAAAPRPAPFRCPPCRCRGTRCGCSGGNCGSISPSARLPRSAG